MFNTEKSSRMITFVIHSFFRSHDVSMMDPYRNVLKVTIDVPRTGELNFYCTQLDHLDEEWRMKQINAIIKSSDQPHVLAGGINSLSGSDYSFERWNNIVKVMKTITCPFHWIMISLSTWSNQSNVVVAVLRRVGKTDPKNRRDGFSTWKWVHWCQAFCGRLWAGCDHQQRAKYEL